MNQKVRVPGYFNLLCIYYPPPLDIFSKSAAIRCIENIASPRKFHRNLRLCYAASEPMAIKAAKARGTSGESIAWVISFAKAKEIKKPASLKTKPVSKKH